ncbi:MAG TPA: hypothetical protein VL123_01810 [Candidatus Udaeobacter sp.]|jgi:hypothetical protein|nr:hypothetical protein [Candidatus Udaeobacter sp.]
MKSTFAFELVRHRNRGLIAAAAFLGVVALGLACAGCGKHEVAEQASASSTGSTVAVPAVQSGTTSGTEAKLAQQSDEPIKSEELVPPEVSAWAADTLVAPGSVIEIQAKSSDDVTAVLLRDGIGRQQPFAFDSSSGAWHTFYRVPMRSEPERLGVSVTARTEHNRWRRVWIFFNVQPEDAEE